MIRKFLCWLGFHDWYYGDFQTGKISKWTEDHVGVSGRSCLCCDIKQKKVCGEYLTVKDFSGISYKIQLELKKLSERLNCNIPVENLSEKELWEELCFEISYYFIEPSEQFFEEYQDKLNNDEYTLRDGAVRRKKEIQNER